MHWTDQLATECQVSHLRQLGYAPDHPLTKGEAARLITDLEEHPQGEPAFAENRFRAVTRNEAQALRTAVESAKCAVVESNGEQAEQARRELGVALTKRQVFWVNTCRDPRQMQSPSLQVFDLYRNFGCRFFAPSTYQAQAILDALDAAMAAWDRDHPELFYQALELNFPELRRVL
jgi:hypothetical protein